MMKYYALAKTKGRYADNYHENIFYNETSNVKVQNMYSMIYVGKKFAHLLSIQKII